MKYNFDELYPFVTESLQDIDNKRIALIKKKAIQTIGFSTLFTIVLLTYISYDRGVSVFELNAGLILAISSASLLFAGTCLFMIKCSGREELYTEYKNSVVKLMVSRIIPNAKFHQDRGISCDFFINSLLTSKVPDRYISEDLVTGRVGETEFMFSEIRAEERHSTRNNKKIWRDVFRGFFFTANFHKDFKGTTLVDSDSTIKLSKQNKMDRVVLEDKTFENVFDVYGTNQVEAQHLLTPSIMERLVVLNAKIASKITLSFKNSLVTIAIPQNRGNFEIPFFSTILNKAKIESEFILLVSLIEIVEDINSRIWSKG